MAWSWTETGRIDSFEFEKIPIGSVNGKPTGKLEGVEGGQLSWKYDSELKVSGSLNVSKTPMIQNCYIRVWYTPELNGQKKRIELATCFASTENGHYEDGVYSGTIELRSVIARFTDDKLSKNYTIPKGSSAIAYWKKMFSWHGGVFAIKGVRDRKASANQVFEWGKSAMEPLSWIAKFLGAQITEDTHGRIVLQKYVSPGKKPVSYTIPSGAHSVTLPGIDITSSQAGTVNRASVRHKFNEKYQVRDGVYKSNYTDAKGVHHRKGSPKYKTESREKVIIQTVAAASSSAISRQKAGRFITECYELSSMSPKTVARAKQLAEQKLKGASGVTTKYQFKCFYLPIKIGQVVAFKYDKINIDGMVTDIDMDLEPGLPMTVTIRKVRNR